jgi:hypothetical protein
VALKTSTLRRILSQLIAKRSPPTNKAGQPNPGCPAISAQSLGNPGYLILRPVGFPSLPLDKVGFIMDSNGINTNGFNLSNLGSFVNYHFCVLHFYSNVISNF